ncbi:MAG TPA: nucleoside recognition domain-containing protein [Thermaerobacter sp.]
MLQHSTQQAPAGERPLAVAVSRGLRATGRVLLDLARTMLPAMIAVTVLDRSGWLARLAALAAPAMAWFGLPGGTALALLIGNVVGLYSGVAAAIPLGLDYKEWTILGTMLAISHAHPVEASIIARAGANTWAVLAARLAASAAAGWLLSQLL